MVAFHLQQNHRALSLRSVKDDDGNHLPTADNVHSR